jgi:magnesium chelatase subunit D
VRRIEVRRDDFHIMRFKQQRSTTTVFVVDASGSSALHRLAEAKGAVELLLADCYVRRDRVAVISFRGSGAEVLLPPTRSLARAKRSLAGLPGGGGTPLASALETAHKLAGQIARSGDTPVVVLLTDGRANIARDGSPGRGKAGEDALAAARALALDQFSCLLIDTSAQPQSTAQVLAQTMRAHYLPLPYADAQGMSKAVRLARPVAG